MQKWLDTRPSRDALRDALRYVCQALTYLHANGIVHADLKLDNILMHGGQPLLNDFDVSRDATYCSGATTTLHSNAAGTLIYMAPELFDTASPPSSAVLSTAASDMWAFGMCALLAHYPDATPYLAPRAAHVAVPLDRDGALRSLLESLLDRTPANRPSADETLTSDYFTSSAAVASVSQSRSSDAALDAFRDHLRLLKAAKNSSWAAALRCRIDPDPDQLIASACAFFATLTGANATKTLRVTFDGERGSDAGGLTTSLYRRLFARMLEPSAALFEARGGGAYLPRVDADCVRLHSIGVAIARAIYDERVVELPLASATWKYIFGAAAADVNLGDLEAFDEQQAAQLKQLMRCPHVHTLELSFAYCGGSESVAVTDHNKSEFVRQKVAYDLVASRQAQLDALKGGFWSLAVLRKPLATLQWRDAVVLLCGASFISAAMVLASTVFEGFPLHSALATHWRTVVEAMGADDLRLLLFFATEQPAIPFGGLCNPRGHAPVDKVTVRYAGARVARDALPVSSVCTYTISVPDYESAALLERKLLTAIRESGVVFERL